MALTGIVLIPVSVNTWMKELCPGDAEHRAPIYESADLFGARKIPIFGVAKPARDSCTSVSRDATPRTSPASGSPRQNTFFGELILKLVNDGKLDLLNSII